MSQRASGYERKERDLYETPEWVTETLLPHIHSRVRTIWEPACGSGQMVRVLGRVADVEGTDIETGRDFLEDWPEEFDAIVTNPPYAQAREFIEQALRSADFVAMLLRTDYDHAKTRRHLFADQSTFAKKIVLLKRIVWFDGGASPSFNHAWFVWDKQHKGPPVLAYTGG